MKDYDLLEAEDSYAMAVEWMRLKEYDKAEECLKKTIALNPRFIFAYIELARIAGRKKNYSMSVSFMKKAIKEDPAFHRLYYLAARYAYKAGDFPLALKYMELAINRSPLPLYVKSREIILNTERLHYKRREK